MVPWEPAWNRKYRTIVLRNRGHVTLACLLDRRWTSKIQSSEGPLVAARGLSTPHPSMMDELQLTEARQELGGGELLVFLCFLMV